MKLPLLISTPILLCALAASCKPAAVEETSDLWEGMAPGECVDGADNDGDGAYDCSDSDCDGAPDCAVDTGATGDDTGATDTAYDLQAARDAAWGELLEDVEGWLDYDSAVGLGFAVVLDGELAYATGVGVTMNGGGVPVDADTAFRWNSVSKFHTALGVMQLVEDGLLDLDAPVTDYLPDLELSGRYDAEEITLHRMMTHTAALPDIWDTNCDTGLTQYWNSVSPELETEPGALFNYSNSGWSLAGRLIEVASGQEYRDYMKQHVLDPAGMATGTFDVDEAVSTMNYTFGYDGDLYTPDIHDCGYMRPASWLSGSAVDLARMAEVMLDGGAGVVSADSHALVTGPLVDGNYASGSHYGYGLYSYELDGVQALSHSGAGAGHLSYFLLAPEQGFAVVAASNSYYFSPSAVATRAAELFLETPDDWESPMTYTDPASWDEYVGTYEDPVNVGTILVTQDSDDRLYIRFVDGRNVEYRLYQYAKNQFFFENDGYNYIRFADDPDTGEVRFLANRYYVGDLEESAAAAPHSAARIQEIVREGAQVEMRGPLEYAGPM